MPFDPFTWAAGYALTAAAKKGIELAFPPSLWKDLEKDIKEWSKSLPESCSVDPRVLFDPSIRSHASESESGAIKEIRSSLNELTIPTVQQWTDALIEQRHVARIHFGTDTYPFFSISEAEARQALTELSKRLHRRCSQHQSVALPHMVNTLDRIAATLDDIRYLHAAGTIPNDWRPVEISRKKVIEAGVHAAYKNGFPYCCVVVQEYLGEIETDLVFFKAEDYEEATGLMHITTKQVALWSALDGELLRSALAGAMFGVPLFTGIRENWNSMVTFIGRVARRLYPNSVHNHSYGISARVDLVTIGVPCPAGVSVDPNDPRISMMNLSMSGQESHLVPFLNFGQDHLEKLTKINEVQAAGVIAKWLYEEWGKPEV